jgi:hypothetical protein
MPSHFGTKTNLFAQGNKNHRVLFDEIRAYPLNILGNKNKEIHFDTLSGRLTVSKTEDGRLQMDFPQYEILAVNSSLGKFSEFEAVNQAF